MVKKNKKYTSKKYFFVSLYSKSKHMKNTILFLFMVVVIASILLSFTLCNNNLDSISHECPEEIPPVVYNPINKNGLTIRTRFNTPENFKRVSSPDDSWGSFLQNLPLKPNGSKVKLYNGNFKYNNNPYFAVVDLPIGKRDLHQCADAIMRLRADYLFSQKRYDEIKFMFVSGKKTNYIDYLNGKTPDEKNLWSYMEYVFSYAGTLSLNKELKSKKINDLVIGDVFIRGGSPGHAVIVVDKCINNKGDVKFMLAQSYMPAQEIEIMGNPNESGTPWYDINFGEVLITSGYSFTKNELKSF
jgi:hypothetical protein